MRFVKESWIQKWNYCYYIPASHYRVTNSCFQLRCFLFILVTYDVFILKIYFANKTELKYLKVEEYLWLSRVYTAYNVVLKVQSFLCYSSINCGPYLQSQNGGNKCCIRLYFQRSVLSFTITHFLPLFLYLPFFSLPLYLFYIFKQIFSCIK